MTEARVEHVDEQGVIVTGRRIESATVLWTTGVAPSPILRVLAAETDGTGRVRVSRFLNLPNSPEVFVIGDAAAVTQSGRSLPGVAQVAIQQGRYVGHFISAVLGGRPKVAPISVLRQRQHGGRISRSWSRVEFVSAEL
jgi:NADH:ubiquinone reductase (H+-translocating)